jgi:hypothetical protein
MINSQEEAQAENRRTIALMISGVKALADREVTASEGADLCRLASDLISRIAPMVRQHPKGWLFRMGIHAANCALEESAEYLDGLEQENEQ